LPITTASRGSVTTTSVKVLPVSTEILYVIFVGFSRRGAACDVWRTGKEGGCERTQARGLLESATKFE